MQFVGVAWYGDDADFQGFVNEFGLTFPQVSDPFGEVFSAYGVASQPAFVVVSPSGEMQVERGRVEADEIDTMIENATA